MTDENGRRAPFFGVTFLRASKKGDESNSEKGISCC